MYKLYKTLFFFIIPLLLSHSQHLNFLRYDVKDGLALSQISVIKNLSDGSLVVGTYGGGFSIYNGRNFNLFSSAEGLANNTVYSMLKTGKNLFWIGTEKGLSRFDGRKFKSFYAEDGLPSETVWCLAEGNDGSIWIGTSNGLAKYHNGKITVFDNELIANRQIWSLFTDSKGNLWIGNRDELIIYDYEKKDFRKPFETNNINTVHSISEDSLGNLWIGTDYGLYKSSESETIKYDIRSGLSNDLIWTTFVDSEGNVWLGTDEGATLYSNGKFTKLGAKEGLTDYKIWSIHEDMEKNIWIGSDEGLFKMSDLSFEVYNEVNDKPLDVWSIIELRKDEYLLGSELQGVVSLKNGVLGSVKTANFNVRGLSTLFVDSKENIWIATESAIHRYPNKKLNYSSLEYSNSSGPIISVIEDSKGIIRFTTYYDGVLNYDGRKFDLTKNNSSKEILYTLFNDSKDRIWVGTSTGIRLLENDTLKVPAGFEWMSDYSILNFVEDSKGFIWTGSYEDGLFVFDSNNLTNLIVDTISVRHGLSNESILALTIAADSNIWVSTNIGFNRINLGDYHKTKTKSILSYNMHDGIPGSEGYQNGILNDSEGKLLISTVDGLVKFDPKKVKENQYRPKIKFTEIKIVDKNFNETTFNEWEINHFDHYLQLPHDNNNLSIEFVGISLTNPSQVEYSYKLNDSKWSKPSKEAVINLPRLSYGNYELTVKARNKSGLWSNEPAVLKFELFAPFWAQLWFHVLMAILLVAIIFTIYLIRINRMNKINKELEERIEERIKYEAKLKKSENELRVAKEAAEKSDKLKSEFLAQMSHEIRTPINSILSYTSLLQEDVKDKIDESLKDGFSIIQNSGHRLIKTIDSILNLSQFQTGSFDLNKKHTNLCNILKDLFEEFKGMADQKNLQLILDVRTNECFVYVDQYTISQLIANLVDNAIKYTENGKIEIGLRKIDSKIAIEVSDTGIGMSDEFKEKLFSPFAQEEQGYTRRYEGSGLGLSLVKKYAEVNKAEIEYSSIKGKGTKFTILLNK